MTITAAQVKELREKTGAGIMDAKKALQECGGDMDKASEYLRQKGIASAEKKSSRIAAEGIIGSYIHNNKIGVMVEVNDFQDAVRTGYSHKRQRNRGGLQFAVHKCASHLPMLCNNGHKK